MAAMAQAPGGAAEALVPPPIIAPPAIPPASIDERLEVTGETVAASEKRARLSVAVKVNDKGPYRFIVDSGADRTVVGSALAAGLGLPPGPVVRLSDMAGTAIVQTAEVESLTIGATRVETLQAPVLPETYLGADGIIGIDALEEQRLMLDFDRREITVQDGRRPVEAVGDEIVVVARLRRGQLIITQVTAGPERLYAIIDTGSEITIGNSALRKRIYAARRTPKGEPAQITSVTGQKIGAELALVPEIKVGNLRLEGVTIAFADVPPFQLFGLADRPALLLGNDVLREFRRVSLDFRNRKVRFQLRRGGIRG